MKPKVRKTPAGSRQRRIRKPQANDAHTMQIRAATYCLRHFPTLWTVGAIREESLDGKSIWRITVVLRYPTGHEGELGELLYDGKEFALVTPRSLMEERARRLAADPALQGEWNEYRRSSLPAKEA